MFGYNNKSGAGAFSFLVAQGNKWDNMRGVLCFKGVAEGGAIVSNNFFCRGDYNVCFDNKGLSKQGGGGLGGLSANSYSCFAWVFLDWSLWLTCSGRNI